MKNLFLIFIILIIGCSKIQYPIIRAHPVISEEGQGTLTIRYDSIIFKYQNLSNYSTIEKSFFVQRINMGFTINLGKWEEYILDNGKLIYYYKGVIILTYSDGEIWIRPHRLLDYEKWSIMSNK
jgi:hypothetical protein